MSYTAETAIKVYDDDTGEFILVAPDRDVAMHMGADEEMTEHLMEPVTVTVCEGCAGTATIYEIGLRDD